MKKRIIKSLLVNVAVLTLTLSSCARTANDHAGDKRYEIYQLAVASGSTTLTYEEWLDSIRGEKGDDGHSPVINIGENGNWFIDGVDTGVKAQGQDGADGKDGEDGQDGKDGEDGEDGLPGKDGTSLITGQGAPNPEEGNLGDSYVDINSWNYYLKTSAGWLLCGNLKGSDGSPGLQGEPGTPGAQGEPGTPGAQGESAFDIYLKYHPEYTGTEEEWINMIIAASSSLNAEYHTVTFDSNGGTVVASQIIEHGYKASKPEDPTKDGYDFIDWVDSNNDHWVFNGYSITEDITLYAVWKEKEPSIPFEVTPTSLTLEVGDVTGLTANLEVISAVSDDESIATVSDEGLVTAVGAGETTIQVTSINNDIAVISVSVTEQVESTDITTWSQPGHLYVHYRRTSDVDYDRWALWMWPNFPIDGEGSLWGASYNYPLSGVNPQTYGYMTREECGSTGSEAYRDSYGQIIDVDLTLQDIRGGKTGNLSPLVDDSVWNGTNFAKAAIGFIIVDQSKINGEDMWVSDGGAESYIKKLGVLMPDGRNSYLHIYCVEDNVGGFTFDSGSSIVPEVNPTLTDETGAYRSVNNITDLKADAYASGITTSTYALEETPGVGYSIFVPSFMDYDGDGFGDLLGVNAKLDYLYNLGVKSIKLSPIFQYGDNNGYDVIDFYKVDSRFGSIEDLSTLITNASKKGMSVILEMPLNQVSTNSVLFQKSKRADVENVDGKEINYRNMFLWSFESDLVRNWNGNTTYNSQTYGNDPIYVNVHVQEASNWYQFASSKYYYYSKAGVGYADLNYNSQTTRDYVINMCEYWLDLGVKGFQMNGAKSFYMTDKLPTNITFDSKELVADTGYRDVYNEEKGTIETLPFDYSFARDYTVTFWKQIVGELKDYNPATFVIGDNFDGWNLRTAPLYSAFDSQLNYATYYATNERQPGAIGNHIYASLIGENSNPGYLNYRSDAVVSNFTSTVEIARLINHAAAYDESVSSTYNGLGGIHHREVNSSNRSNALNKVRYLAALTLLNPGLSWINYGDEIGMSGNINDNTDGINDHGNNTARWYRQPMKWGDTLGENGVVHYFNGQFETTWDAYNQTLANVSAQENDSSSLLNFMKSIIAIKNNPNYPTYGVVNSYGLVDANNIDTCYLQITDGAKTAIVLLNNSASNVSIPLNVYNGRTLLGASSGGSLYNLPAYGFVVLKA